MGLDNLFSHNEDIYSEEDFSHYGNIIKKLKKAVCDTFNITNEDDLYFTAPTFITRIDESTEWTIHGKHDYIYDYIILYISMIVPINAIYILIFLLQGIHDEYWHLHVDMNNTQHYHYGG